MHSVRFEKETIEQQSRYLGLTFKGCNSLNGAVVMTSKVSFEILVVP